MWDTYDAIANYCDKNVNHRFWGWSRGLQGGSLMLIMMVMMMT